MHIQLFLPFSLLLVLTQGLRSERYLYTTSENRTKNVENYCVETVEITDQDRSVNEGYRGTLEGYFSGNASQIMTYLIRLDFTGLQTQTQTIGWGYVLYVGPFVVGLATLIIMWPFLLCCCICPASCPTQACRKSRKEMYGECQLLWPVLFLAFLCLLAMATSIPAMTRSASFFQTMQCSSSMMVDNLLNGNVTESGDTFFVGLNTAVTQFAHLQNNLTLFKGELDRLDASPGSEMETANNYAVDALSSIRTLPDASGSQLSLSYDYPLHDVTNSTGTLPSVFATELGTYDTADSITYTLYHIVEALQDSLLQIKDAAISLSPQLNAADVGSNINKVITSMQPISNSLQQLDTSFTPTLELLSQIDTIFSQYSIIVYGCTLGICLLVLIALVLIRCFHVICCRHLMYLVCGLLFVLCLVCLVMSCVLAVSLPMLYYSCQYLESGLASEGEFREMVKLLGGDSFEEFADYFSVCLEGGDGQFVQKIDGQLMGEIEDLQTAIFNTFNYNFTSTIQEVNSVFTSAKRTINNYGKGRYPDFSTTSNYGKQQISTFNSIKDKTSYDSSCPKSSYAVFYTDVWVPSTSDTYQQHVGCEGKVPMTSDDCASGMDDGTCPKSRCMDAFDFLMQYADTGSLETAIDSRYGTTCTAFNEHMKSFYTRYVVSVETTIGNTVDDDGDTSKVAGRFMEGKDKTDTLLNYMNSDVKPLFTSIENNLMVNAESIVHAQEGLLAGLDCRLVGEDMTRMVDSICIMTFNQLFFTFVILGLISFSLLFSICCIVCVGVQHYKHAIKQQRVQEQQELRRQKDQTATIFDFD